MLFTADLYDRIRNGDVTLAFRRWKRPTVTQGGTLQSPGGLLRIVELTVIEPGDITEEDATLAGFTSIDAVHASLRDGPDRRLYRVRFARESGDPRIELRERAILSQEDRAQIDAQFARWDKASRTGPWARQLLEHLAEHPAVRSLDLVEQLRGDQPGIAQPLLKRRVRQLKGLGLTESLGTGYRVSPRGKAYLASTPAADDYN